ncbi:MAG: HD domain-containing protein [Euryarchaeota archaeon]|nr:HD domain-containing protein [Euryarchaeota archaeon]
MAMFSVERLRSNEQVDEYFIVVSKKEPKDYTGDKKGKWFEALLEKAGEQILIRYWGQEDEDVYAVYSSFDEGDIVHVVGTVGTYKSRTLLYVSRDSGAIEKVEGEDAIRAVLLTVEDVPWASETVEELEKEFWELVDSVKNKHLNRLLHAIFSGEFWERFRLAPAAVHHHSAYVHGLLHHTVNVARIAQGAARNYPVDRDVLITGALLHDVGKVEEYEFAPEISESVDGYLMGHIYMGARMVEKACEALDIPEELRKKVVHIILSHHNRVNFGWGSARDPMTAEAFIVAYADNMDANVAKVLTAKYNAVDKEVIYVKGFGFVYAK